jgi:hypothetical protein
MLPTLCCESSARDTMTDLTKAGVGIEHFGRSCLQSQKLVQNNTKQSKGCSPWSTHCT